MSKLTSGYEQMPSVELVFSRTDTTTAFEQTPKVIDRVSLSS